MDIFRMICLALSQGLILGLLAGLLRQQRRHRKNPDFHYTPKQLEQGRKRWKTGSRILTYTTFGMLMLGFIWCLYFLVLALVDPGQAEYANNLSEMIVGLLTIISIGFAFYEFLRQGHQKESE
ncbi:transporter [Holdemania massiliensis]|uniref:transporter n=1 Tax=Holdemania massiliensis TaxID=1468449 RepID=UPI001F0535FE|nr:transporter [Holdemania massiliensis]MCH1942604.1 transporter [Holdemania massiliensis]